MIHKYRKTALTIGTISSIAHIVGGSCKRGRKMSTRRAKQHKSDVIVDSGHRKWLKSWNHKGFGSKWRMEASGRAPKFRARAYNRAKELEKQSLNSN